MNSSRLNGDYRSFLERKAQSDLYGGFTPTWFPSRAPLFDFQSALVEWATRKGKAALFEDCGLGKTPQLLTWAENVVRKTNGKVLVLTPLGVATQTEQEAEKFGVDARRQGDAEYHHHELRTTALLLTE